MLSPQSAGFHLRVRPELGQSVATGRCFLGQDVVAQWRSLSVSLGRGIPLAWLLHACFLNRKSLPLGGQVRPKQNCLYPKPHPCAEPRMLWNRGDPRTRSSATTPYGVFTFITHWLTKSSYFPRRNKSINRNTEGAALNNGRENDW
jgi:hypothetical protein